MIDPMKTQMKVCIVTSWFPNKNHPNIAPFVFNFAKNLGNSGVNVSVIIPNTDNGEFITDMKHMIIYRVAKDFPLFSIFRLIKKIKPDIIHVHAPNIFSSNAIIASKFLGIPIIATVHRAEIDKVSSVVHIFRKLILGKFDKIIAVSNFTRALAIKAGVKESNISIIYNSCDETIFSPKDKIVTRQKMNIPNKKIILYVGNLVKIKDVSTLIKACMIVSQKGQDFLLLIIGDGEERKNLESLVISQRLEKNIRFVGWLPQSSLPDYYNSSDIFVLPSLIEGHSVALLESMTLGLPAIASSVGGNLETITDGKNGFLFRSGDPIDLSEKLLKLLTDDDLRVSMSTKSSSTYQEKFSADTQIKNHMEIYHSLMKTELLV